MGGNRALEFAASTEANYNKRLGMHCLRSAVRWAINQRRMQPLAFAGERSPLPNGCEDAHQAPPRRAATTASCEPVLLHLSARSIGVLLLEFFTSLSAPQRSIAVTTSALFSSTAKCNG